LIGTIFVAVQLDIANLINQKSFVMKKAYFLLALLFLCSFANSQVTLTAVVVKKFSDYQVGDSVKLYGFTKSRFDDSEEVLIKKGAEYKAVSASKFSINGTQMGFWDNLWFYNRSGEVLTKGWENDLRTDLLMDCREFIQNLQKNKLLFEDDYLQDYLSQLVHKICPTRLNKQKNSQLTVYVMKSRDPQSFSFDNGTIVISSALLAGANTEGDLVKILSKEITNVVLEHNLLNLKQQIWAQRTTNFWTGFAEVAATAAAISNSGNGSNNFTYGDAIAITLAANLISSGIMERIGANYTVDQLSKADFYSNLFLKTGYSKMEHKTPDEYTRIISDVISYTSWQNLYALNYSDAINLINRLENAGVATEDDYLLKAKIYRTLYNTDESNYEALRFVAKAKTIGLTKLVDLDKEEGLLYLRIGDKAKAKLAFEEYRTGLEDIQAKGGDNSTEIRWVKNIMFKNNL